MSQKNKTFGETLASQRGVGLLGLIMGGRRDEDPDTMGVSLDQPASKKGSTTVPEMCSGGKVLKSWGK